MLAFDYSKYFLFVDETFFFEFAHHIDSENLFAFVENGKWKTGPLYDIFLLQKDENVLDFFVIISVVQFETLLRYIEFAVFQLYLFYDPASFYFFFFFAHDLTDNLSFA